MRNGQTMRSQPQLPIEEVRNLMNQVKNAQNPQAMLTSILNNNSNTPMIATMLNNGNSLEGIARWLAQAKNVDINKLINDLNQP